MRTELRLSATAPPRSGRMLRALHLSDDDSVLLHYCLDSQLVVGSIPAARLAQRAVQTTGLLRLHSCVTSVLSVCTEVHSLAVGCLQCMAGVTHPKGQQQHPD